MRMRKLLRIDNILLMCVMVLITIGTGLVISYGLLTRAPSVLVTGIILLIASLAGVAAAIYFKILGVAAAEYRNKYTRIEK